MSILNSDNMEGNEDLKIDNYKSVDFKKELIRKFNEKIKEKKFIKNKIEPCGDEGHWLEKMMGIKPNSNNEPDIYGYEQKKDSKKITYGDWQATCYLFNNNKKRPECMSDEILSRKDFIKIFGSPNPKKKNRYSWSGSCFPKYGDEWNSYGQRLIFDDNNNLLAQYSYNNDEREEKNNFPDFIKNSDPIIIAFWSSEKLKTHIKNKFGVKGFYILKKNKEGEYSSICFGKTIDFEYFYNGMISKTIILDSGMYISNTRNYSQFRSNGKTWDKLITEEY